MKDYIGIHLSSFKDQFGIYETSISRLNDNGIPEIVHNEDGHNITPSVVEFIDKDSIVVGRSAQDSIGINDENIVRLFNDELSEDKTYKFFGKKYSQVSIIAMFLKALKRVYEKNKTHGEFNRVAIMVPTFYTRQDKRIIRKAAELAGYSNFSIIHENELAVLGGALYAKQTEKIGNRVEKMELTEVARFYYGIIITEHETGKQFVRNLINKDEIIIESGSKKLENEANKTREELKQQLSSIVVETASKIIDEEIDEKKHENIIKKAAEEI